MDEKSIINVFKEKVDIIFSNIDKENFSKLNDEFWDFIKEYLTTLLHITTNNFSTEIESFRNKYHDKYKYVFELFKNIFLNIDENNISEISIFNILSPWDKFSIDNYINRLIKVYSKEDNYQKNKKNIYKNLFYKINNIFLNNLNDYFESNIFLNILYSEILDYDKNKNISINNSILNIGDELKIIIEELRIVFTFLFLKKYNGIYSYLVDDK